VQVILTYDQRQAHWNWCREFIDREAIYRVDDTHPEIPGKAGGRSLKSVLLGLTKLTPAEAGVLMREGVG
jgi:hypothetical protein